MPPNHVWHPVEEIKEKQRKAATLASHFRLVRITHPFAIPFANERPPRACLVRDCCLYRLERRRGFNRILRRITKTAFVARIGR
jgi:hypothetical protein